MPVNESPISAAFQRRAELRAARPLAEAIVANQSNYTTTEITSPSHNTFQMAPETAVREFQNGKRTLQKVLSISQRI